MTQYGAGKPCQRTGACIEAGPHPCGAHLDPRHPLYDGPITTLNALPGGPRRAAYALLAAGAPTPEVVEMAEEILRLRGQVAAVRVDMDRQVTAAMRRAEDCAAHGEDIKRLEEQVLSFSRQADRNDAGRVELLRLVFFAEDVVRAYREEDAKPTTDEMIDALAKMTKKVNAAHMRAWKK